MSAIILLALLCASTFAAPSPVPQVDTTDTSAASADALSAANTLSAQIANFPDVGQNITNLGDSLTTYETSLGTTLNLQDTQTSTGGCAAITVIFARGTTEPGNVGNVDVQGVPYPADIPGFLVGGSPSGIAMMAAMVSSALASCPSSKVVMAGYSQGGQLVHNAAKLLPASTTAAVNSAVIFGDPDNGEPVTGVSAAQTLVICYVGDDICAHGDLVLTPHLTYSENAGQAAAFVAGVAGL